MNKRLAKELWRLCEMSSGSRIYVASPLRAETPEGIERNRQQAEAHVLHLQAQFPKLRFCAPQSWFPKFLDDNDPKERQFALECGQKLLDFCDGIVFMGDTVSDGMREELYAAAEAGKAIYADVAIIDVVDVLFSYRNLARTIKKQEEVYGVKIRIFPHDANHLDWRWYEVNAGSITWPDGTKVTLRGPDTFANIARYAAKELCADPDNVDASSSFDLCGSFMSDIALNDYDHGTAYVYAQLYDTHDLVAVQSFTPRGNILEEFADIARYVQFADKGGAAG